MESYCNFEEVTPTAINEFISKIEMQERDVKRARYIVQRIKVYFNYIGKFENELTEEIALSEQECQRMGRKSRKPSMKLLPDAIPLTEEQFKTFLEKTITTEHSRRILDELTAQNAPTEGTETAAQGGNTPPTAKTAHTAQGNSADGDADGGAAQG